MISILSYRFKYLFLIRISLAFNLMYERISVVVSIILGTFAEYP